MDVYINTGNIWTDGMSRCLWDGEREVEYKKMSGEVTRTRDEAEE